ncbi:hypothetical protein HK096_010764, partial [Nowakowskiella sp. JEL0078]
MASKKSQKRLQKITANLPAADSPHFANQTHFRAAERHFKRKLASYDSCFDPQSFFSQELPSINRTKPAYFNSSPQFQIIELPYNFQQICPEFGNDEKSLNLTRALVFNDGLIFIPNPFSISAQRDVITECLRDYPNKPNVTNLDTHYLMHTQPTGIWDRHLRVLSGKVTPSDPDFSISLRNLDASNESTLIQDASKAIKDTPFKGNQPLPVSEAVKKLRWASLGYYYN